MEKPELYFPRDVDWREWLAYNHENFAKGIYLIFYKLETNIPTMRWEEAVKVAISYGWIDSTVQSLGGGKRRQHFGPRNPKSSWSKLNKQYIDQLNKAGLMHESGLRMIAIAKESGTWTAMDDVENGIIPKELQQAFDLKPTAFQNYKNFAPSYRKSYLSWLHSAKREETRAKRISEIIRYCAANIKSRDTW